eukprot:TRINITY_DN50286_c0_g1_i1.p1 TRINITY_DN50286_c0_g1~~TRINITY_DN50286_c0_g1_i1.p1  ORF type:complete len:464 (-),score=77.39 TRINITY_DN50286_c0_g1_i1:81-1433(-)
MGCHGSKGRTSEAVLSPAPAQVPVRLVPRPVEEPRTLLGRRGPHGRGLKIVEEERTEKGSSGDTWMVPSEDSIGDMDDSLYSSTGSGRSQVAMASCRKHFIARGPFKDTLGSSLGARGRHYSATRAAHPGGIKIEDLLLGVKLACLAYTDDQRGTVDLLAGTKKAIEAIAGGPERARRPLTQILEGLGYHVDRIFSHAAYIGSSHVAQSPAARMASAKVDTNGFIAHNDEDVVLSFRGSTGIVEWLTDLAGNPVPFQPKLHEEPRSLGCLGRGRNAVQPGAHEGFYDALLASLCDINQKIMPQLRDTSRAKRLVIVGHSIGGAIAMGALGYLLQSFDFATSPHRILFVSTGQPRFGDEVFAVWLNKQIAKLQRLGKCIAVRLINDCDAVPTVPSSGSGFCHAAKLCLLTHEGDLLIGPEVEELRDVASLAEGVDEHRTDHYLQLLAHSAA